MSPIVVGTLRVPFEIQKAPLLNSVIEARHTECACYIVEVAA